MDLSTFSSILLLELISSGRFCLKDDSEILLTKAAYIKNLHWTPLRQIVQFFYSCVEEKGDSSCDSGWFSREFTG